MHSLDQLLRAKRDGRTVRVVEETDRCLRFTIDGEADNRENGYPNGHANSHGHPAVLPPAKKQKAAKVFVVVD